MEYVLKAVFLAVMVGLFTYIAKYFDRLL